MAVMLAPNLADLGGVVLEEIEPLSNGGGLHRERALIHTAAVNWMIKLDS